jgi:NAD(P)-dependent dehydrogenase (short-subunit alcohol dehydrogenase family)
MGTTGIKLNQLAEHGMEGAVVLVTGGAKGIGREIAAAFLACGCEVIICGRAAPTQVPAIGAVVASFFACDVRDPGAVARLFEHVAAKHGRLDVLVNNAGGGPPVAAATASPRLTEKIVQLNLLGPLYCAQAANRLMQLQDSGGSIINIASVSGERPSPGTAAYGAAKAGLLHATQSLAMEWGPKVRVNAIVVGLMDVGTPAAGSADDHYGGPAGVARINEMLPLKRMARPSDVASACLYLASGQAAYVSGARLAVHGGGEPPAFLYLTRVKDENT